MKMVETTVRANHINLRSYLFLFLWPLLPMCRANLNCPPSFGVDPGPSNTTGWKDEFVHTVPIYDCKEQVTVRRNILDRTDMPPHVPLLRLVGYSTLI